MTVVWFQSAYRRDLIKTDRYLFYTLLSSTCLILSIYEGAGLWIRLSTTTPIPLSTPPLPEGACLRRRTERTNAEHASEACLVSGNARSALLRHVPADRAPEVPSNISFVSVRYPECHTSAALPSHALSGVDSAVAARSCPSCASKFAATRLREEVKDVSRHLRSLLSRPLPRSLQQPYPPPSRPGSRCRVERAAAGLAWLNGTLFPGCGHSCSAQK
ncbi:hypothetical protein DPEC_G00073190 [Dallia pectoralis]|uniref:Uncharacterized protein n=1 Tax=Dallia pectoralis TaxID=75939 RepID=A0ACC2H2W6_DALPE|nr:hypothetical protein DPEC_G00073190 [Dallia pectoralis]